MKTILLLKKIFAKRKESTYTNAGFIAGLIAGIVIGVFSFIVLIINKELYFQELALLKEKTSIPIPDQTIWLMSLIAIPPIIVIIYSIVGLFSGLFLDKTQIKNSVFILILSSLLGFIWGIITNLPAKRLTIVIFNIGAWLLAGIIFVFVFRNKEGN